jgi:hypothetical protein
MAFTILPPHARLTTRHYALDNPMDVQLAGRLAYEAIIEEQSQLKAGETLAVVISEDHSRPTHILANDYVLHRLNARQTENSADANNRFMLSIELPYNQVSILAKYALGLSIKDHELHTLPAFDTDGTASLTLTLACDPAQYAPTSQDMLFSSALELGVPVAFTDAARFYTDGAPQFDLGDPALLELASKDPDIAVMPLHGAKAHIYRNQIMARRSFKKASELGARTILAQCGGAHTFGMLEGGKQLDTSLMAAFNALGCKTLAINFTYSHDDDHISKMVDPAAWRRFPNSVVIDNLSDECFFDETDKKGAYEKRFIRQLKGPYDYAARLRYLAKSKPTALEATLITQNLLAKARGELVPRAGLG